MNSVWREARPLVVTLDANAAGADGGMRVALRAIHDRRAISILAMWNDPTESQDRLTWLWDHRSRQYYQVETPTDLFALKFCIEGAPEACMMTGQEGVYDVWEWRAGWTHLTGYADDRKLVIGRSPPSSGDFQSYPLAQPVDLLSRGLDNVIHVQWHNDEGELPYEFVPRPPRYETPSVYGIRARNPTGSAADVLAEAVYENGAWAVEFWRLLHTGFDDDYSFDIDRTHAFSIAATDGQEGQAHLTSGLIRLAFK
jgi:hypothetical protein